MSPTARTMQKLRDDGWICQVVETFNRFGRVRQDLFGVIDIVAIRPGRTLGVQACTGTDYARRVKKCKDGPGATAWIAAGNELEVWAWRKLKTDATPQHPDGLWSPKIWQKENQ